MDARYAATPDDAYWQTANVLPLAFGIAPEAYRQRIADGIAADVARRDNHLDTGVLGTRWLWYVLTEFGHVDAAYAAASSTTFPSYGYWRSLGATTLWEEWAATSRSQGHPFFGSATGWLSSGLAGLGEFGAHVTSTVVRPNIPSGLSEASATIATPGGDFASHWRVDGKLTRLHVRIPLSVTAEVWMPVSAGQLVQNPPEATFLRNVPGYSIYRVPCRAHSFAAQR